MRLKTALAAGALAGAAIGGAAALRRRRPAASLRDYLTGRPRVLILGGGFAGLTAARELGQALPPDAGLLLVDRNDFMTFWPMVPEVIPGSIELQHVLRPLRQDLLGAGAEFLQAEVTEIDLERRLVYTREGELPFDRVIIALGWHTTFFGTEGASEHTLTFQSIEDAIAVRDRVICRFEEVSAERTRGGHSDSSRLSFVVVGGGSTGVETAANLSALVSELLPGYPRIAATEPRVHLLQAADAILPHLDGALQRIAAARIASERIDIDTKSKVHSVDAGGVVLEGGERIDSGLVLWAAGVGPSPIAAHVNGAAVDSRGRLQIDQNLRLRGHAGVYAVGDIAGVNSAGQPVPPTAQAAVQAAAAAAQNLVAELRGGDLRPFKFHYLGTLVDLGGRFAVSQFMGRRISGWIAQAMWRAVYLYKLGDRRDRVRVLSDWLARPLAGAAINSLPLVETPDSASRTAQATR
ncbi:MAG TPA: NAD(P)/FAD-dependent oxidoreductase [Candidatus Acidoferrales bacterium]|nr:NAD(P)/FAD-dependent oxidoreductase [Candidatus Acidoferrales bacterium]